MLTLYREILPRGYYILEDLQRDKTLGTDLSPGMTTSTRGNGRPSHDRIPSPAIDSFEQETQPDVQAATHGEAGFDTQVPTTSSGPRIVAAASSALTAESGEDPTKDDKDGANSTGNICLRCIATKIWRFFWGEDVVEEFGPPTEWLWE